MRKVYTKGIDFASKHVLMAATAYNIKKLLRYNGENSFAARVKITAKELINDFIQSHGLVLRHLKSFLSNRSIVSEIYILRDYICFEH